MCDHMDQPYAFAATDNINMAEYLDFTLVQPQCSLYDNVFHGPEDVKKYLEEPLNTPRQEVTVSSFMDLNYLGDDYNLAAATLEAEATGTKTPLIREELRYSIQRKRRLSGLEELQADYKIDGEEELSLDEQRKREDRRARNKVAARKCRQKKKIHAENVVKEFKFLECKNTQLRQEIRKLEAEREKLDEIVNMHLPVCRRMQVLPPTR